MMQITRRQRIAAAGSALALAVGGPLVATRDTVAKVRTDLRALQARVDVLEGKTPPTSVVPTTRPTPTTQPAPAGACAIDPADGEVAITAAIASCPNGSIVRFPSNRSYTQANRILVADRVDLVIDGNGSTFTTTADGRTTQSVNPNWLLLRGRNVTLRNMTSVGSFSIPGPRSLAKLNVPEFTEAAPNYGIYGTDGAWLVDVKGFRPWGDGVTLGPAHYADAEHSGNEAYARNVHVIRMVVETTARHCWSPTSGVGVWIEDSICRDAWYAGLDAELDGVEQTLRDHHYLRNTFDGFGLGGLLVPVPGEIGKAGDIEIRGNRFLTAPDQVCNQIILVGAYPDIGPNHRFDGVVVADNELRRAHGTAISLDHVTGGAVTGNTIGLQDDKGCNFPNPVAPIKVTASTGVNVEGNRVR